MSSLMLPFVGNIETSVARIKTSWQHHPEALVPAFAGIYLESRQPTNGPKSIHLLSMQADLFQLAADSPSILRGLDRTARYLAAKTEFELLQTRPTNAAAIRMACIGNISRARLSPDTSVAEFKAYFYLAMKLGKYDLARDLINHWEELKPQDASVIRARIDLEIAAGNLQRAWKLTSQILSAAPDDTRALADQQIIQKKLAELIEITHRPTLSKP
jgi:tetratricopeptide (TPR) repeat protein